MLCTLLITYARRCALPSRIQFLTQLRVPISNVLPPSSQVVAVIRANGSVDTTQHLLDAHNTTSILSGFYDEVANRYYTAGGNTGTAGGVRSFLPGARTSSQFYGGATMRGLITDAVGSRLVALYAGGQPIQGANVFSAAWPAAGGALTNFLTSSSGGTPFAAGISGACFGDGNNLFTADTTHGLVQFRKAANNSWPMIFTQRSPNGEGFRSVACRNGTSGFELFGVTSGPVSDLWHFAVSSGAFTFIRSSPEGSVIRAVAWAPRDPAVEPPAPSSLPTPSPTATPSATEGAPSPSPRSNAFSASSSVLVVRVGSPSTAGGLSAAMPVTLDEVDTATGGVYQSLPVPGCAATMGFQSVWSPEFEHSLTSSADGTAVSFPCYATPAAGMGAVVDRALPKPIAVIDAQGLVDMTTVLTTAYSNSDATRFQALRAAFVAGAAAFVTGTATVDGGFRVARLGRASPSIQVNNGPTTIMLPNDPRGIGAFNGRLFVSVGNLNGENAALRGIVSAVPDMPNSVITSVDLRRLNGTQVNSFGGATLINAFVFESASRLWVADDSNRTAWSIALFTLTTPGADISVWSHTASFFVSRVRPVHHMTGRTEEGAFVLYFTQLDRLFRLNTVTGVSTVISTAPSGQFYRGVSLPPVNPAFLNAPATQPSPRPVPSASPVPALASPSSSPIAVNAFQAGSLLVSQVGNGDASLWNAMTLALPVVIHEVDPATGAILQSRTLPTSASGSTVPCTMLRHNPAGATNPAGVRQEYFAHFPQTSGDGQLAVFTCIDTPAGSPTTVLRSNVITTLDSTGAVESQTRFADAYLGSTGTPGMFRTAYTHDGSFFWITGRPAVQSSAFVDSGVRGVVKGARASTLLMFPHGLAENRYCSGIPGFGLGCVFRESGFGQLSQNMVIFRGPNGEVVPFPTTDSDAVTVGPLPGMGSVTNEVWTFVAESSTRIWATTGPSPTGGVLSFFLDSVTSEWTVGPTTIADATQAFVSMTGRLEGGHYILYLSGQSRITAFNTTSRASRTVVNVGANAQFRGVLFAPVAGVRASPTATPTGTPSPSTTATVSTSGTASITGTPVPTASISPGAEPSTSQTAAPSVTGSPSGTRTPAATPSPTSSAQVALWLPHHILALRAEGRLPDGSIVPNGGGAPLFLDAYEPQNVHAGIVGGVPLPTSVTVDAWGVTHFRCVIRYATTNGGTEGMVQRSFDGRSAIFGCFDAPINATVAEIAAARRVIAVIWANGESIYQLAWQSSHLLLIRTELHTCSALDLIDRTPPVIFFLQAPSTPARRVRTATLRPQPCAAPRLWTWSAAFIPSRTTAACASCRTAPPARLCY